MRDRNFGVNGAQAQEVSTICLRLLLLRVIRSSDQISLVAPILLRGFQLIRTETRRNHKTQAEIVGIFVVFTSDNRSLITIILLKLNQYSFSFKVTII